MRAILIISLIVLLLLVPTHSFALVSISNLGLDTVSNPSIDGNLVTFVVREFVQGNADLNGDGDSIDGVGHIFDASTGTTTNLGLASSIPDNDGNLVTFDVRESAQGNADLNGDGDSNDRVVHVFDAATGITTNLGLASFFNPSIDGNLVMFVVGESAQGNTDLNGDDDSIDPVVHVAKIFAGGTLEQAIEFLVDQINIMGLPNGIENSLSEPLDRISDLLSDNNSNNDTSACRILDGFIKHVNTLEGTQLTSSEANSLRVLAEGMKSLIGCP